MTQEQREIIANSCIHYNDCHENCNSCSYFKSIFKENMRTIFVRFYYPNEVMDVSPETTDKEIKDYCFRVNKYETESGALDAYANTAINGWSTILSDDTDVKAWIDEAYEHIKNNDIEWLENNFV